MEMGMKRTVAVVVCLCGLGCGGGSTPTRAVLPPTPTPPPTRPIVLRDGATGAVVDQLPAQLPGSRFSAVRAGYLPRTATFRGDDAFLWPQDQGYVTALVYTAGDGKTYGMGRWAKQPVVVGAPDDPRTLAAVQRSVDEVAAAAGIAMTVVPGVGDITIEVDAGAAFPSDRTIAFTRWEEWSGHEMRRVRIVFRHNNDLVDNRKALCGNVLLHELGHALGFYGHSTEGRELMAAFCSRGDNDTFGESEKLALRMMYTHRLPGNVAPDTEPEGTRATSGAHPLQVE
jgi:hypothetical protein